REGRMRRCAGSRRRGWGSTRSAPCRSTTVTAEERLLVALDVEGLADADRLLDRLAGLVGACKIGAQLFTAAGPAAVEHARKRGFRVFLDLKFHDIPNTLAGPVRAAGLDGCVASPREVRPLRNLLPPSWIIVTPGVRPAGGATDDQARTATPAAAIAAGADYVVVGRSITGAPDPAAAAQAILAEIHAAPHVSGRAPRPLPAHPGPAA